MGSHSIPFYATRSDLEQILAIVDAKGPPLSYVLDRVLYPEKVAIYKSLREFADLGIANDPQSTGNRNFCVLPSDSQIVFLSKKWKDGIMSVADLGKQPHLNFRPAGVLNDGVLIMSEVNVLSQDPNILKVFELFRKEIKRQSKMIRSVAVCSEAEKLLDKGWRLTSVANTIIKSELRRRSTAELRIDDYIAEICVDLKEGTIDSIEIISVLGSGFSFDALSIMDFEHQANARLIVNEPSRQSWFEKLLKSLRNLNLRLIDPNIRPPDISWGIIFRSAGKTRTIYLSFLGTRGIIEGKSIGCDGRLLKVVKSIS